MAVKKDKRSGAAQRGDAITRRVPKGASGVEVGVFRGVLSRYLLSNGVGRLFMVDSWLPAEKQPGHYKATRDYCAGLAQAEADSNRDQAREVERRYSGAKILNMPSIDAAKLINDGSMDFVFLDGDHSYEGLTADIAAWLPKVRKGGWLMGHDYRNPMEQFDFSGVDRAVDETFGDRVEIDDNFTWHVHVA